MLKKSVFPTISNSRIVLFRKTQCNRMLACSRYCEKNISLESKLIWLESLPISLESGAISLEWSSIWNYYPLNWKLQV
ncbi:hypothetical protein BIV59_07115 [Bacillus sp. MUM 13]|nr:hypothetical protein BIV59_07115 [Bacillus sp. MUM 13]